MFIIIWFLNSWDIHNRLICGEYICETCIVSDLFTNFHKFHWWYMHVRNVVSVVFNIAHSGPNLFVLELKTHYMNWYNKQNAIRL